MRQCNLDHLKETHYYNMLTKLSKQVATNGISWTKALEKEFKWNFLSLRASQLYKTRTHRKFFIKWLQAYLN